MPLVAAQSFVAGLLQGLVPPGGTGLAAPIDALITPHDPDVNPDGIARVYVWPATGPGKRIAMPRNSGPGYTTAGSRQIRHDLQVFLVWMDSPEDPDADINFPLLIDYVWKVLETSPSPSLYTSPDTGDQSQMVNLGEEMSYDFVPPRTLEPQMMRRYDARIRCSLLEIYQG